MPNRVLTGSYIDDGTIRKNFQEVIDFYSFEQFLKEHGWILKKRDQDDTDDTPRIQLMLYTALLLRKFPVRVSVHTAFSVYHQSCIFEYISLLAREI